MCDQRAAPPSKSSVADRDPVTADGLPDWYPRPSSIEATKTMKANRRRDTRPELAVRRALHAQGLRYRVDHPIRLPGRRPVRVDIAFTRLKLAVFIDGCFWHCCPDHGTTPTANQTYWGRKLGRNVTRDREIDIALAEQGWTSIRIWEHCSSHEAVATIRRAIQVSSLRVGQAVGA